VIVSGLKILAVAVAWVAGVTAAAGVPVSASVAIAPAVARNFFMSNPHWLFVRRPGHTPVTVFVQLTLGAYGFPQARG